MSFSGSPAVGSGIVNQGLQVVGGRTFNTVDNFAAVQAISVDDNSNSFGQTDTSVSTSRGTIVNFYAQNFDATPTRNAQTISMTTTIATGNANFTIRGIALHFAAAANVTTTSNTLFAGLSNQSIAKSSNFSLAITLSVQFQDNS